jgi:hypothetical protein
MHWLRRVQERHQLAIDAEKEMVRTSLCARLCVDLAR